jgi:AcrR family transcriptional regulator
MQIKPIKQRILDAAVELYNKKGVNNVTLRDIAAELGISSGNLAYHFANQDFIIEAIFQQMEKERGEILMGVQQIPSFENINRQILPLLTMAQNYRFIYLDSVHIIRKYPSIAVLQQTYFENSIQYVKAVIDLSVGMGNLKPEQTPGHYQRIAHTVWMLMNFWLEQLTLRGLEILDVEELRLSIWDLVLPHLTERGVHHFQKLRADASIKI